MKRATIALAVLSLVMVFSSQAMAQFEFAAWDTLTSDSLRDGLSRQPMGISPNRLHLVYSKTRLPDMTWGIHYRYFDINAGWSADEIVVESDTPSFEPVIAANRYDTSVTEQRVAILFASNGDIYGDIVGDTAKGWLPVNMTNNGDDNSNPAADFDATGLLHMAWVTRINNEYEIAYGYGMSPDNMMLTVISNSDLGEFGLGANPVVVTVDGVPHIFYRGVTAGLFQIHHAYRVSTDDPWIIERLVSGNSEDVGVSAAVDSMGQIHVAIYGGAGFGFPSQVYYLRRSADDPPQWTSPALVTGDLSATDANIAVTDAGTVYVISAGLTGNIYNGDIYVSNDSAGTFATKPLGAYPDASRPDVKFINGATGAIVFQATIGGVELTNFEIVFYGPTVVTGIDDDGPLPRAAQLAYNYPNPFNARTVITVQGVDQVNPPLDIYDITGRKIQTIEPFESARGVHRYQWDGRTNSGNVSTSGTYFYAIAGASRNIIGKMTLLK